MLLRSIGFMVSPSLISFIFDCAKNNLVDQLFDRSAIIGKIHSARMLFAYTAIQNAFPSHTLEQWIRQVASIYHEIVQRAWRVGANYHAVGKACCIDDIDI